MQPLKVGIIGFGRMGFLHASILRNLPEVELAAVTDPRPEAQEQARSAFSARAYTTTEMMLAEERLDAVVIATPNDLHLEPALLALDAGLHLYVEKPLAATVADCRQILERARSKGKQVMVGHVMRFDPRYALAREQFLRGEIGDLVALHGFHNVSTHPQTTLRSTLQKHVSVHMLDLLLWIAGSPIRRLFCRKGQARESGTGVERVGTLAATLEFGNGAIGSLHNTWSTEKTFAALIQSRIEIIGTEGVIQVDATPPPVSVYRGGQGDFPDATYWPTVGGQVYGALSQCLKAFCMSLRTGEPVPVPGEAGLQVVAIAEAMEASAESGTPVSVPTP